LLLTSASSILPNLDSPADELFPVTVPAPTRFLPLQVVQLFLLVVVPHAQVEELLA
jgi:hypothetical protein